MVTALAGYDLETTGPLPDEARIVTSCVGVAAEPGRWEPTNLKANPGIPIPEDASKVHGVYDEDVAEAPPEAVVAGMVRDQLYEVWATGGTVCGFNLTYDFTVLDRALRRADAEPLEIMGPVLDALVLDKMVDRYRRGSKKLTDVCRTYGIQLVDAHTADADAFASLRLCWRIVQTGVVPGGQAGPGGERTPTLLLKDLDHAELHDLQVEAYAEQRASFFEYLARKGETPDDLNLVWPLKPFEVVA